MAAVASCGGGLPNLVDLKGLPEAGLHPPDAIPVSHNEREAEQTVDGPVVAIVGDVFATEDDAAGIFAWYENALAKLGWVRDDHDLAQIKTVMEDEVRVWRRGDVVARLAIYRAGDPQLPPMPAGLSDGTMFELALIAKAPEASSRVP